MFESQHFGKVEIGSEIANQAIQAVFQDGTFLHQRFVDIQLSV